MYVYQDHSLHQAVLLLPQESCEDQTVTSLLKDHYQVQTVVRLR